MNQQLYEKEIRPWGKFIKFVENQPCTVKILYIMPDEELSLQMHKNRREHWYFLDEVIVQINDKTIDVKEGELIVVEKNTLHRIISKGKIVKVLEISFGNFDENDEIRIEDKYNRERI